MKRALVMIAALTLGGCATSMDSSLLPADSAAGAPVDGLPYRQRVPLMIELYQKTDKGYELVAAKVETLADPLHVNVLSFRGDVLANPDVKIAMAKDSSLTSVDLKSSPQASKAITDVSKAAGETATAYAAMKKAQDKAKTDADDKAEAALAGDSAKGIDVATAVAAALVAQQELAELPADAPPSARTKKAGEVKVLMMRANEASRRAGELTRPFPDL